MEKGYIVDGEILKVWKDPLAGIYIIDFPSVSVKICEDDFLKIKKDLKQL